MNTGLQKLIDEGEHQQQDFKYCINNSKKIAKSIVAFANSEGGRLLIGVKDNGKIAGIRTDEEYYMIESAAQIFSKPPIPFTTKEWHSDGKTVLQISIKESDVKPHYARDENGKWLAYIRIRDENVLAHKIQLLTWHKINNHQGIHFTYSDDEKFLIDYLQHNNDITFTKFIRQAHISRKKAEEILSNFIIMDVITINTTREGTVFALNTTYDQSELKKFS